MKDLVLQHFEQNADKVVDKDGKVKTVRGKASMYAYRRLKNWEDAEDSVQEAYTRALAYSDGFKEGSDFDCWFFIILANVINNVMYRRDNSPELVDIEEAFPVEEEEPSTDIPFSEDILRVNCNMRERSILSLYHKYGHVPSRISKLLNVPYPVVLRTLKRYVL